MGAEAFQTSTKAESFREAVDKATADALYWHGHGGYTGTIAEKDGAVEYEIPWDALDVDEKTPSWDAINVIEQACMGQLPYGSEKDQQLAAALVEAMGLEFIKMAKTYDEKWGPAVGFKMPNGEYGFCGWASS